MAIGLGIVAFIIGLIVANSMGAAGLWKFIVGLFVGAAGFVVAQIIADTG